VFFPPTTRAEATFRIVFKPSLPIGFVVGAGGGFAGGFAQGFGNSLMHGESFGNSIGSGLGDGFVGGIFGGSIGGITSGIKALTQSKSFWDGASVTRNSSIIADLGPPLPTTQQIGQYDCSFACMETIDSYKGGTNTQGYYKNLMGGANQGVKPTDLIKNAGLTTTPQYATILPWSVEPLRPLG
jgi:hypothetical protein